MCSWCHAVKVLCHPQKSTIQKASPKVSKRSKHYPRTGGRPRHHFGEIIFMALTGIEGGVKSYELMEEFCQLKHPWFEKWIERPNEIPCYNTLARGLGALAPGLFSPRAAPIISPEPACWNPGIRLPPTARHGVAAARGN